jgi:predicted DNA-binding protein YlxM (UPF0122 family)
MVNVMFEKNMKIAYLLDFYGDALDDHTSSVMRAYYNDDLSLAEIAADEGISRQGVRHLIKKGEEQLSYLEEKLGLAKREKELVSACKSLSDIADKLGATNGCEGFSSDISEIIGIILKGNQDVSESD